MVSRQEKCFVVEVDRRIGTSLRTGSPPLGQSRAETWTPHAAPPGLPGLMAPHLELYGRVRQSAEGSMART